MKDAPRPPGSQSGCKDSSSSNGHVGSTEKKIPYPYDPVPRQAMDLLESGKIEATDLCVLRRILRYRKPGNSFAWVTVSTLIEKTGYCRRTIYNAFARLAKEGLALRVKCPIPDPDDIDNSTGYRFSLPYVRVHPDAQGCALRCTPVVHQDAPNIRLDSNIRENQPFVVVSSSSSREKSGDDDDEKVLSLGKESWGSKQEANPLSDKEGRAMVVRVAAECKHLPDAVAHIQTASNLANRCGRDWRLLAAAVVRLDGQVSNDAVDPQNVASLAVFMLKEMRSIDFSADEMAELMAGADRRLNAGQEREAAEEERRRKAEEARELNEQRLAREAAELPLRLAREAAERPQRIAALEETIRQDEARLKGERESRYSVDMRVSIGRRRKELEQLKQAEKELIAQRELLDHVETHSESLAPPVKETCP